MKNRIEIQLVKKILIVCLCFGAFNLKAQDIQFSQFYTAALYQNPAFAGSSHANRFAFHQRLQWPSLDSKYITSMVSYDTYSSKHRSGFGFVALRDWQGASTINSTDIALQYAYEIHLSSKFNFRPGLQASYVSRNLDYAGITLPVDWSNNGYVGGSNLQGVSQKQYLDFSSGGIAYSDNLWFGFSVHHINRPNQTFVDKVSRLPAKVAFTGGYKIRFKKAENRTMDYLDHEKEYSITPTFHYKFQGTSDQLDLGIYGMYDYLLVGLWYRGIPTKYYNKSIPNNESIVVLAGWKYEQISVTYSYDFTVSRLARARTGGSHELNITYIYKKHKKHKLLKRLPCPNFNR